MICSRCLQRASALSTRAIRHPSKTAITWKLPIRPISSSVARRNATVKDSPTPSTSSSETAPPPPASRETAAGSGGGEDVPVSSCPEGTILAGLNYFKNRTDPVAMADSEYPAWLWRCLDVQKKVDEEGGDDAGDEFSKSKKQRRLAAKRQRAHEARLIAEGNIEALAPKIPLQHQSINLPANEEGTTEGALAAQAAREELRKAMRRERKAKIKEDNYLKSM